ncbi:hypothetical protein EDB89DRAFT_1913294 [Lactarius sanguifluus]|nr:hypothetical protein EDB89DRAFT_1913294 [Lactarius sanguifluus]
MSLPALQKLWATMECCCRLSQTTVVNNWVDMTVVVGLDMVDCGRLQQSYTEHKCHYQHYKNCGLLWPLCSAAADSCSSPGFADEANIGYQAETRGSPKTVKDANHGQYSVLSSGEDDDEALDFDAGGQDDAQSHGDEKHDEIARYEVKPLVEEGRNERLEHGYLGSQQTSQCHRSAPQRGRSAVANVPSERPLGGDPGLEGYPHSASSRVVVAQVVSHSLLRHGRDVLPTWDKFSTGTLH